MMHGIQAVTDQSMQGATVTETDWPEDEAPEHHEHFQHALLNDEIDLLTDEPGFSTEGKETGPHSAVGESTSVFLDSAEFQEVLEDLEFRADLKWACQFTFKRFSQSTHSTWEDLQQEVLIRFGRWLPRYRKEAKRKTVFARIARNVLIDAKRSETSVRRQHEQVNFEDLEVEPLRGEPRTEIENRIFLKECRQILSQQELIVFDEHFVYGKSLRQLANKHGVSPAAMSKRWARIMTKLHPR